MEIKASDLRKGVEVDLPIDWAVNPPIQCTIKYDSESKKYMIAEIKSGTAHYKSPRLSDIVRIANESYQHIDDVAIED